MRPWVAFIESNTTGTGRLFALRARSRGYTPIVLAEDPRRYPYVERERVDCLMVPTHDLTALRDALATLAPSRIAGIFSSSEYFVQIAARLAAERGLPAANAAAIDACRNKHHQRCAFEAAGLLTPMFVLATSPAMAVDAARRVGLPVVVKPTHGSGSVGVRLCRNDDEVADHATSLLACRVNERGLPSGGHVLVEELMRGPEYSVETFGTQVIGVTAKHVSAEPYFIETGHDFPARLSARKAKALGAAALRGLEVMELGWGPAHVEIRHTARGPVIIEINPRLAGGFIPELVRWATGIDLVDATIALVTATQRKLTASGAKAHASIRFVLPPRAGRIAIISGVAAAEAVRGVVEVTMYRQRGDACPLHHDFRDRAGHVMAAGPSGSRTARAAEAGRRRISLRMTRSTAN